jgi:5-formyltetrahydrofolate cyclo-ligase
MPTQAEQKAALRKQMRQLRAQVDNKQRAQAIVYCNDLLFSDRGLNLFNRYRSFTSYMSFGDEFPTDHLHDYLLRRCPYIQVPRFDDELNAYTWEHLSIGARIEAGPYGILQPMALEKNVTIGEIDVVFVPGLCFDVCGGRLGYGAGIYDRLLGQLRQTTIKIALAFDCQVVRENLPQEPHDVLMDYIVTGHSWVDCRRARQVRRR